MTQKLLLAASILFILAGVVLHIVRSQQRQELPSNTIALVNGYPVVAEEIEVDRQKIASAMRKALDREPSDEELLDSVKNVQRRLIRERLARQIRAAAIEENGIEVKDEEVRSAVLKAFPKLAEEPQAVLENEIKLGKARAAALREAVAEPEREREIYEQHLKDLRDYRLWQAELQHYQKFPEKIDEIESNLPESVDDIIERYMQIFKPQLINQKLMTQVIGEISISDEELSEGYEAVVKKAEGEGKEPPEFEDVKPLLHAQILAVKQQRAYTAWLNAQIAELEIEVKDENFAELFARAVKPAAAVLQTREGK